MAKTKLSNPVLTQEHAVAVGDDAILTPPPLESEPPHKRLARLKPIKDCCSIQGNAIPATRRSPGNQSGTSKGPAPGTDAVRTSADQTESL
jgi:hypothetical protein